MLGCWFRLTKGDLYSPKKYYKMLEGKSICRLHGMTPKIGSEENLTSTYVAKRKKGRPCHPSWVILCIIWICRLMSFYAIEMSLLGSVDILCLPLEKINIPFDRRKLIITKDILTLSGKPKVVFYCQIVHSSNDFSWILCLYYKKNITNWK